jgi:hypothetical protein
METRKVVICTESDVILEATEWRDLYACKGIEIYAYQAIDKDGGFQTSWMLEEELVNHWIRIPIEEMRSYDEQISSQVLVFKYLGEEFKEWRDHWDNQIYSFFVQHKKELNWDREDTALIEYVEKTQNPKFKVIEIPADVKYHIVSPDWSREYIAENHRTWY